jgi:hypothetical protein
VSLDRKEIVIEAVKAKSRTARIVPISTPLIRVWCGKGGLARDKVFRSGQNLTISADRDPLEWRDPHESPVGPPYCPHRALLESSAIEDQSVDRFDSGAASGRLGQGTVAGDDRCVDRLGKSDVHGVVCADIVSQLPRTTQ